MLLNLLVKYHVEGLQKIEKIEQGDWIDLRSAYDYELKAGDFKLIDLGVTVKIPHGYEMNIVPRSSTFKNWGIIQVNHFGIVDESYCGESDFLMMPVYATRNTIIKKNDRICQFRLNMKMPLMKIIEVDKMEDPSRGGFGSTGVS